MRTKLYVGLFVMAIVGIVAGERFFNRLRGAQEPPKKAEAGEKKDAPILPPLPAVKSEKPTIPPPLSVHVPPPLPAFKTDDVPKPSAIEFQTLPPMELKPVQVTGEKPTKPMDVPLPRVTTPASGIAPVQVNTDKLTFPPLKTDDVKPASVQLPLPAFGEKPPVDSTKQTLLTDKMVQVNSLLKDNKLKEAETLLNEIRTIDADYIPAMAARRILEARLLQDKTDAIPPVKQIEHNDTKPLPTVPVPPSPAIAQQIAKLKSSPWSLRIDMIDGQTVVNGTVNHKHTFKIVCNSLELNTGKDMLKAIGKVTISGDMLTGTCESLQIALLDDRLVLEGGADVRIQKAVSDAKPTSFELKGDTLNLRISDLQTAKLVSNGWQQVSNSGAVPVRPATTTKDAQWSKWGTLRRMEEKSKVAGETVWCLEDRGTPILILVARDGGTLSQYEGRRISVYGANEQIANESMLRVSHIALP